MNKNNILNLQGLSFVFGCRILTSQKIEGAPSTGIFHIRLSLFVMPLLMFNDKQRFWKIFSGEEISRRVSRGGQSRGFLVGKLLFPISQDWQQGPCTHTRARHPFLLQKVTTSKEEAGNVNKEHACFHFDRYLSFVLLPYFLRLPHRRGALFMRRRVVAVEVSSVCSTWSIRK